MNVLAVPVADLTLVFIQPWARAVRVYLLGPDSHTCSGPATCALLLGRTCLRALWLLALVAPSPGVRVHFTSVSWFRVLGSWNNYSPSVFIPT